MKVKINDNVYEVTKNGKPLVGKMADMEAWMVFTPRCFKHVAVASFPASFGKRLATLMRAMTFAVDEPYIDTVIAAVEKKWPKSTKNGKLTTRSAAKRRAPGCRGPGSAGKKA